MMSTDQVTALLEELKAEREKFTKADDEKMDHLISLLVLAGEYPATTKTQNTVKQMVSGWGAYWHRWTEPLECPKCHTDLRDHKNGPPFKREIQIYPNRNSSRYHMECPDCKYHLTETRWAG